MSTQPFSVRKMRGVRMPARIAGARSAEQSAVSRNVKSPTKFACKRALILETRTDMSTQPFSHRENVRSTNACKDCGSTQCGAIRSITQAWKAMQYHAIKKHHQAYYFYITYITHYYQEDIWYLF